MKKKIKEIIEMIIAILAGFLVIALVVSIYFYIQVMYFPLESSFTDVSIEEMEMLMIY